MKTNENVPKANGVSRLDRIQTVSGMLRMLIFICLILQAYFWIAFCLGWPFFFQGKVRMVASPGHIYTSPSEMPGGVLALLLVKCGLGIFGALVLQSLLRLYQQGILFSAKNVRYIRLIGYCLIIGWGVDYQLQSILPPMALSTTQIGVGLLIIYVAWIMDEGRKIQEEQELTV